MVERVFYFSLYKIHKSKIYIAQWYKESMPAEKRQKPAQNNQKSFTTNLKGIKEW